jgi:hypothetical protein
VINTTSRPLYPWARGHVPIVQVAGWAPELVWTGAENVSTGIRSPDRRSHNKSLYRLRYPGKPLNVLLEESHFKFVLRKDRSRLEGIWGGGVRGLGPVILNLVAKWR